MGDYTKVSVVDKAVVLFDGVCNLCNGVVRFVIERDNKDYFRFAPLQSDIGKNLLSANARDSGKMDSIVLLMDGRIYVKSDAAIRIAKHLPGIWKCGIVFLIIPRFIRDFAYDIIARNRYRWFGKKQECMVPSPDQRAKFLSD